MEKPLARTATAVWAIFILADTQRHHLKKKVKFPIILRLTQQYDSYSTF